MRYFRSLNKLYLGAFVITACIAFLFLVNLDASFSRTINEIFNFGHLPLFGVIALGFAMIFTRNKPLDQGRPYVSAWLFTSVLGILTEVIQIIIPGRYFEVSDILHDVVGAGCFLILAYSFPGRTIKFRRITHAAALTIVMAATIPIFLAADDEISMHKEFPLIGSFESQLEMKRWHVQDGEMMRSSLHATHGDYSLKAQLLPGEYPGVSLGHMVRHWKAYDRLVFDVFLDGDDPLKITVRIQDKEHNDEYDDRYNKNFELSPGSNVIAIDLKEVMSAPKDRTMDMNNIENICIFSHNLAQQRILYFDNFRLE